MSRRSWSSMGLVVAVAESPIVVLKLKSVAGHPVLSGDATAPRQSTNAPSSAMPRRAAARLPHRPVDPHRFDVGSGEHPGDVHVQPPAAPVRPDGGGGGTVSVAA